MFLTYHFRILYCTLYIFFLKKRKRKRLSVKTDFVWNCRSFSFRNHKNVNWKKCLLDNAVTGALKQRNFYPKKLFHSKKKFFVLTHKLPIFSNEKMFLYFPEEVSYICPKKKNLFMLPQKGNFLSKRFVILFWKTNFL